MIELLVLLMAQNPGEGIGIDQKPGGRVDLTLRFVDETGQGVALGRFLDSRPAILTLVYYECPALCIEVLRSLASTLKVSGLEAGRDYSLVAISIDPGEDPGIASGARDTFAAAAGTKGGIHFLTGKDDAIRPLAESVGFRYRYDPESKRYAHAAGIMILTPDGRVSRYFLGVDFPPRQVRLALVEASEGRVGTFADALTLLCLTYDPESGRYGFAVLTAVRIGGVLTAAVLGIVVASRWRRDRRGR